MIIFKERIAIKTLKINVKNLLDIIIVAMFLMQLMVFRWLGISDTINDILFGLLMFSMFKNYRNYVVPSLLISTVLFIIYPFLNWVLLGGTIGFTLRNLYRLLRTLLIIIYFCNLLKYNCSFVLAFLRKCFLLFNLYFLINIPVLILQIQGHYHLAGFHISLAGITYMPDLISGTFGLYGTPVLALYSVFLILYNFMYMEMWCKKKYKTLLLAYDGFVLIVSCWVSAQNDNKGFYLILMLFVVCYYIAGNEGKLVKNSSVTKQIRNVLGISIVIIIVGAVACLSYTYVDMIRENVDLMIYKFNEGYNNPEHVKGSGERIGMIMFGLSDPFHSIFGYGLGLYLNRANTLGFVHFGQADFGSYLCLGGLLYLFFLFSSAYFSFARNYKRFAFPLLMVVCFIILSIYTQPFYNSSSMICSVLIYALCTVRYYKFSKLAIENQLHALLVRK